MGISFGSYGIVNEISAARGVTLFDPAQLFVFGGRPLDSRIPYLAWTAVIYVVLYHGCFYLAILTYPKTRSGACELFQMFCGLIIVTLIACLVFLLFPAEMTLRASADYRGGSRLLHDLNLFMRQIDRPFNTWPCLHVAQSGLILLVVGRWLGRRQWTIVLWLAWTALAISTLTVRQHFILDIITGSLLALGYWQWKLRIP